MNKKRLFSTAVVALSIPVLLAGCFGSAGKTGPTTKASTAPAVTAPSQPVVVVPQPDTTQGIAQANTPTGFAKQAAIAFPDAKATTHFTKSEVQQALYTAQSFADVSLNNQNFIGGNYAKRGYQPLAATTFYNFMTSTAYQHLKDIMTKVQQKDDAAGNQLFSLVLWFPEGGSNYSVCTIKDLSCQPEGYPKLSNYTYAEGKDGTSIGINFNAVSHVMMTVKGTKGYVPVTNTMSFRMVKRADYKGGVGTYPFAIDGWTTKYVSDRWTH